MNRILLFLTLLIGAKPGSAQAVRRVLYPTITVSDLDRVLPFYTHVLPFEQVGIRTVSGPVLTRLFALPDPTLSTRIATLRLGADTLELMDFVRVGQPETGRPIPADSHSNDGWFQHIAIVVSDMDKAYAQLRQHKVTHISTGPQTLPAYILAAAGVRAFYFRDPDGHSLELISFPPGKGRPGWQRPTGSPLFLGIDHTAIGSDDTDASLAFYRDLLGLKVGGNSENYGPEQEHLNQVYGARLLISGLTTGSGLGIELLDYIAPPGGRSYPTPSQATDLWHWHTTLLVSKLDDVLARINTSKYTLISPGIVPLAGLGITAKRGLLVRDPDGHALLLCE